MEHVGNTDSVCYNQLVERIYNANFAKPSGNYPVTRHQKIEILKTSVISDSSLVMIAGIASSLTLEFELRPGSSEIPEKVATANGQREVLCL